MLCRRCLPLLQCSSVAMATSNSVTIATSISLAPKYLTVTPSRNSSTTDHNDTEADSRLQVEGNEERGLQKQEEEQGTDRTGFYRPFSQNMMTMNKIWPHKDLIDKLYTEVEEREKDYLGLETSHLRYDEEKVLKIIKQPKIQEFINELQEKYLGELPQRIMEATEQAEDVNQMRRYPQSLMGLDPFNYIREELAQQKAIDEEFPTGSTNITTGMAINKLALKTPLDIPYLIKNEGFKTGISEFFKIYFLQGKSAGSIKYKSLKNRGFDHETSDRSLRNKTLAAHLQDVYLKHFELISDQRWNVLLDYMAKEKVMDIMKTCTNEDEDVIKAWFDVKYIENNDKPKILSHMELPIGDQKFVQVLVKMNVKVECLYFTEEEEARVGPQDMIHYVVFERDTNDILSNFRILDKVREADIEYFKRHKMDEESLKKTNPKLGDML